MQENQRLQEVCETLRARIAQLLDEMNTRSATEWTEVLNREQIKQIRRCAHSTQGGFAKSS